MHVPVLVKTLCVFEICLKLFIFLKLLNWAGLWIRKGVPEVRRRCRGGDAVQDAPSQAVCSSPNPQQAIVFLMLYLLGKHLGLSSFKILPHAGATELLQFILRPIPGRFPGRVKRTPDLMLDWIL